MMSGGEAGKWKGGAERRHPQIASISDRAKQCRRVQRARSRRDSGRPPAPLANKHDRGHPARPIAGRRFSAGRGRRRLDEPIPGRRLYLRLYDGNSQSNIRFY
ncbi:hypothetical protein EVAR_9365_1 [Eumeta japonica]|uniref:Uncharacterized protein n=1 Tax=Eumeta variegata TaxID=151549 RepID=A0A4C1YVH4_EUMVA|nr:hypothetical protein EVAR_9365_1 [Eumeta japonica]